MAMGFLFKNLANSIQIDENYKNVSLKQKIVSNAYWTVDTLGYWWVADVTAPSAMGLVAFKSNARISAFGVYDNGDGTFNHQFVTPYIGGQSPPTVTFYVFGEPSGTASGMGLLVRNAANEVVFNSSDKPMRVTDVVTSMSTTTNSIPIPSGRDYAACIANPGKTRTISTLSGNRVRSDTQISARNSGTSIETSVMNMSSAAVPAPSNMNGYTGTPMALVIDVTGY